MSDTDEDISNWLRNWGAHQMHFKAATELDRLRADNAAKDARIAELEAAGSRLGDAAIDGILTGMENISEERTENEALRKELAEAKAVLASYANAGDGLVSLALEKAKARIVELEEEGALWGRVRDRAWARAERAEAERDDLRGVLEQLESILVRGDKSVSYMLMKVRAALNPAAGEKS